MDVAPENLQPPSESDMLDHFRRSMADLPDRQWFTRTMIGLNVLVFGYVALNGVDIWAPDTEKMLEFGANFGPRTMNGEWWRLLSCMFLHFGLIHLGMNLWVFSGLAKLAERWMGTAGLFLTYFVSGVGGGIFGLLWNPHRVCAGASGAVFGTAGALLGFVLLRKDTIPALIRNQLVRSMAMFLLLNTAIGFTIPGIDMAAHAGGFLTGMICGLILSQPVTSTMADHRLFRNAFVLLAACVLIPASIFALPPAPPDFNAEMQQQYDTESRLHQEFNRLVELNASEEISAEEFSRRLESEILPQWTESLARTRQLVGIHKPADDDIREIVDYMQTREESWRMLAKGMRDNDAALVEAANQKSIEADELVLRRSGDSSP